MHQDDVRWVIVALRQMYDCNNDYGESCYRLLARNGNFIYLQTKGFLEIDKETNKVHSFICVNTLLDEEEGRQKVQQMKDKFSIIIQTKIPSNSLQDVPASQNPQQLERIVLYLIENLQKRAINSNNSFLSNGDDSIPLATESPIQNINTTVPFALMPPEPASVKNSITQSVSVVNVTAAKILQKINSPLNSPEISHNNLGTQPQHRQTVIATSFGDKSNDKVQEKISAIKRLHSSTVKSSSTELPASHTVIKQSLDNLELSLDNIKDETHDLCEKRTKLSAAIELPTSMNRQLNAIIVEHHQQKLMLNDIKVEYEDHLNTNESSNQSNCSSSSS